MLDYQIEITDPNTEVQKQELKNRNSICHLYKWNTILFQITINIVTISLIYQKYNLQDNLW